MDEDELTTALMAPGLLGTIIIRHYYISIICKIICIYVHNQEKIYIMQ